MSHSKERAEKVCLNCGAALIDKYCHKCGQENIEPQQNLWHLIVHFFNDFTHFDGKFFSTIRLLMLKPGFLALEYMQGRRASYLDPIRMYIFTSAVSFLIIFSLGSWFTQDNITTSQKIKNGQTAIVVKPSDKSVLKSVSASIQPPAADTSRRFTASTFAQYDSLQNAVPEGERDGKFGRYVTGKMMLFQEKYQKEGQKVVSEMMDKFFHSFPQIFFISLPFFALILYLLNIRRRNKYYFVTHVIFSVHFYCACYILLVGTALAAKVPYGDIPAFLISAVIPIIYLYKAMRRFYMQGAMKTIFKLIIAQSLSGILILVLFIIYMVRSMMSIADKT